MNTWTVPGDMLIKNYLHEPKEKNRIKHREKARNPAEHRATDTWQYFSAFPHFDIAWSTKKNPHSRIQKPVSNYDTTELRLWVLGDYGTHRKTQITLWDKEQKSPNKKREHIQKFMQVKPDILTIPKKEKKRSKCQLALAFVSFNLSDT